MILDTSALVAILAKEPDAEHTSKLSVTLDAAAFP